MMTTINDIHDLALILEEHPEWRAEIRRLVLTDDLLEMPARMERQEIRMDNLETRMDRLEAALERLADTTAALAEQVAATNQRIEEFRNETNQRFNRVEADIGDLKGHFMEGKTRENAPIIAALMDFQWINTLPKGTTISIWREAESAGLTEGISRDERVSFWEADLVIEAATSQGERRYIAVEASYTANGRDTRRVVRNADYLNRFTGLPSFAAVASVHLDNRVRDLVDGEGIWTSDSQKVFWYQIQDIRSPR